MSLYCTSCGTDHDYDLAVDDGECVVCGDQLIHDDGDLPSFADQMEELTDMASVHLGGIPGLIKETGLN